MKVSGGTLKGRRIRLSSSGGKLRPTTSKVKEALFDILAGETNGARFLDLYAGTGAIGLEALSRGASEVFFVEINRECAGKIRKLLSKMGVNEKGRVATKKTMAFLEWAGSQKLTFDIIFLDPPYHTDELIDTLRAIGRSGICERGCAVVAEHFFKRRLPDAFGKLQLVKNYRYGDSALSLYRTRNG